MTERPTRVRVTGPPRHPHAPATRTGDLDEQTELGAVYLDSLLRAQLGLALRSLAALVLTVGAVPLVFGLWPGLADVDVRLAAVDVPLAWLLLGVVVYPWLLVLGWVHVRRAERHEHDFALLLQADVGRDG